MQKECIVLYWQFMVSWTGVFMRPYYLRLNANGEDKKKIIYSASSFQSAYRYFF